ncbi:ankyrin repeat-containing protein NPR4-like [Magnolia sinica]|uniref:ankyrin repeat-containing protein NPR4-like n=1 Tax=Magnolia sinica TaxID=86752 RepID=UPI00265982AF|nr:ankyrin repeat-containing protein NPR4-like [Magnolia sinica]
MDLKEMVLKIFEELRSENENSLMKELGWENENSLKELRTSEKESSLKELIRINEPIFDRFLTEFVSQTPLHIAIQHGSVYFAREILGRKPQLAHVLSSQGFSPLYMASANGSVDIVKELLPLIADVSYDRDSKGWTPVHAAAMKGHINVLEEFKRIKAEWIRDMTDRDETVLHLYVKYNNQVDELRKLRGLLDLGDDKEFVNRKDANGNTILHLAAMKKDTEMITYLISTETGLEINAMNMNGFTALDVFALYPSNSADRKMVKQLRKKRAERSREKLTAKATGELRNALMLVGTLTATLCFQAALVPPGGLWQDDSNMGNNTLDKTNHTAGTSILADKDHKLFGQFQIFNQIVFLLSLILILAGGVVRRRNTFRVKVLLFLPGQHYLVLALTCVSVMIYLCNKVHTPKGLPHEIRRNLNALNIIFVAFSSAICSFFFIINSVSHYRYLWSRKEARNSGSNVDTGTKQRP